LIFQIISHWCAFECLRVPWCLRPSLGLHLICLLLSQLRSVCDLRFLGICLRFRVSLCRSCPLRSLGLNRPSCLSTNIRVSLTDDSVVAWGVWLLLQQHLLLHLLFVQLLCRGHIEVVDDVRDVGHSVVLDTLTILSYHNSWLTWSCLSSANVLSVVSCSSVRWSWRLLVCNIFSCQFLSVLALLLGKVRIDQWLLNFNLVIICTFLGLCCLILPWTRVVFGLLSVLLCIVRIYSSIVFCGRLLFSNIGHVNWILLLGRLSILSTLTLALIILLRFALLVAQINLLLFLLHHLLFLKCCLSSSISLSLLLRFFNFLLV